MAQVDELLERINALPDSRKEKLYYSLSDDGLTPQQFAFVDEYTIDFNRKRAAAAVGMKQGPRITPTGDPEVLLAVAKKLEERAKVSALTAEYVRQYLLDVLELTPTDYFVLASDGSWMIDPADFAVLPHSVKRLVDGVELKRVGGQLVSVVKFVSKASALAMAAKFTLTEKHTVAVTSLPWDQVVEQLGHEADDPIAKRLAEYGGAARNGEANGHAS